MALVPCGLFFFFNDTATTEIYTLSLHDALPISRRTAPSRRRRPRSSRLRRSASSRPPRNTSPSRSEEHTSELQSLAYLVCRLLLEKKKTDRSGLTTNPTPNVLWQCPAPFPY